MRLSLSCGKCHKPVTPWGRKGHVHTDGKAVFHGRCFVPRAQYSGRPLQRREEPARRFPDNYDTETRRKRLGVPARPPKPDPEEGVVRAKAQALRDLTDERSGRSTPKEAHA